MAFELLDTLTNSQRVFTPLEKGKVRMYVCGVTVYDMSHIGHARAYIVWDTLRRYLTYLGYDVTYVQNYTDIDDKIITKANTAGIDINEVTKKYIAEFEQDMTSLNILPPTINPKATEYIPQMLHMVEELEAMGHAYDSDGDVLFDVCSFDDYLKLSKRKMDNAMQGEEGAVKKKNQADFSLWKKAKPNEPYWESKWGNGRPGWHLECSAMIRETLGETIDIHCGGADLIFPHHENEIAQSEAITHKPLANFWLHNGFVNIDNEKMSKSLSNFVTIRDVVAKYNPMALRFFVLSSHYRTPLDFSYEALDGAWNGLKTMARGLESLSNDPLSEFIEKEVPPETLFFRKTLRDSIEAAMSKDFNTPAGIAVIFKSIDEAKKLIRKNPDGGRYYRYFIEQTLDNVFGLDMEKVMADLPKPHIVNEDSLQKLIIEIKNDEKIFTNLTGNNRNYIEQFLNNLDDTRQMSNLDWLLSQDVKTLRENLSTHNSEEAEKLENYEINLLVYNRLILKLAKRYHDADERRETLQTKYNITMEDAKDFIRWFKN